METEEWKDIQGQGAAVGWLFGNENKGGRKPREVYCSQKTRDGIG